MNLATRFRFLLLAALSVLLAGLAWGAAGTPATASKTPTVARKARSHRSHAHKAAMPKAKSETKSAGMRIYLDPESGQFTSAPVNDETALMKDLDPLNDSDVGLQQVQLPDGSWMLDHKGRFAENAVIFVDPAGNKSFRCVKSRTELLEPIPNALREDR